MSEIRVTLPDGSVHTVAGGTRPIDVAQSISPRLGDAESGVVASLTSTEISIVSGGLACIAGVIILLWRRPSFWKHDVS